MVPVSNAQAPRGERLSPWPSRPATLSEFQIDRLRPARIRLNVKGNALTLRQDAYACCFNRAGVDEHILFATFRRNKTEALLRIEELDRSNRLHLTFLFIKGMPHQRVLKRREPASSGEERLHQPGAQRLRVGYQQLRFIWRDAIAR
jgi:hypothetical protein